MTAAPRRHGGLVAAAALATALATSLGACTSSRQVVQQVPRQVVQQVRPSSASRPFSIRRTAPTPTSAAQPSSTGAFPVLPARGAVLAPGPDPRALPADVLIADEDNHRLLLVGPAGQIRWQFPRPGDLPRGQVFGPPDDAFVSPDGRAVIATQEMDDTVSLINIATGHITRQYGHPGVPGSGPDYFSHPDDAMLLPGGDLLVPDMAIRP